MKNSDLLVARAGNTSANGLLGGWVAWRYLDLSAVVAGGQVSERIRFGCDKNVSR